jgi:hypothetical protein
MQTIPNPFRPAQDEVHRAAHDQDLTEVPRRARLDREAEQLKANEPFTFPEPVSVPEKK